MIKRLWLGWRICRKQGVKFKPRFRWVFEGMYSEYNNGVREIEVSLFNPYFWEILFHELGHKMEYDRVCSTRRLNRDYYLPDALTNFIHTGHRDQSTRRTLGKEVTASRTAMKLLRKFGLETPHSKRVLERAFYTYTNGLTGELKAGACYAGYRKICY